MIVRSSVKLSDVADEVLAVVDKVSATLESADIKPIVVPTYYAGTIAFSLRRVPIEGRAAVANVAWGAIGKNFRVYLFEDRFVIESSRSHPRVSSGRLRQ
jgi:hypothetical protein